MNNKNRYMPVMLALCVVLGIVIGTFYANHFSGNRLNIINSGSNRLNNLLHIIDDQYVDKVNLDSLVEKAIPQILAELDPHSVYMTAKEVQATNDDLKGSFSGVGIEFVIREDTIHVQGVIKNGPAERAGLLAGDKIVTIDDSAFVGKEVTNQEAMRRLKGPKDTKVKIGVARYGQKDVKQFTVTRGEIPQRSITSTYMIDDHTGYIRIKNFGENTYGELLVALATLAARDLRTWSSTCATTQAAISTGHQIANEFLPKNNLIVYTEGRKSPRQEYRSNGHGSYQQIPLVVLINEGSASASEIFAGAMQDNDRATIIGRRSFGKGLVQQQIEFADGGLIRLTIARYYTPSGRCIQKPYEPGHDQGYEEDIYTRYEHGEFFSQDSIKHTGPAYHTGIGRDGVWRRRHHARHLRSGRHHRHHVLLQGGSHERSDSAVCLRLYRRQPPETEQFKDMKNWPSICQAEPGGAVCQLCRQERAEAPQPDDTEVAPTAGAIHQQPHHLQHARRGGLDGIPQSGRPRHHRSPPHFQRGSSVPKAA